ncbi:MAG TPA: OmpA family protein [Candidatus Kapabacteria bacterium]|nr:OmpA family protein [Candidatus Kapabacteria bacterium]
MINRSITAAALILAALLVMSSTASAQMNKVVALVKGSVQTTSGSPVSDVQIQVYKGGEKVTNTKSTSEGKFQMVMQPNTDYKLICTNSKYYYTEQAFSIPALEKYQEVPVTVTMRPLELGSPFPFSAPVFAPKSKTISQSVTNDLDNIAAQMKRNTKLTLNVTVYPDEPPTGKKANAQNDLASARKNAIAGYFLSKGLNAASVSVSTSNEVPPGKFTATVTTSDDPPAKGKKKKKSKAPVTQNIKAPQTADIVMQVAS